MPKETAPALREARRGRQPWRLCSRLVWGFYPGAKDSTFPRDVGSKNRRPASPDVRCGSKADVTSLESDVCITPESRHHPIQPLLHLIAHRMGQGLLVLQHRAKIAHVEITAAQFAFPKVFGFC